MPGGRSVTLFSGAVTDELTDPVSKIPLMVIWSTISKFSGSSAQKAMKVGERLVEKTRQDET